MATAAAAPAGGGGAAAANGRSGRRQLPGVEDDHVVVDALSKKELARLPEVRFINKIVAFRAYGMVIMRGVGALLVLWSTAVLLGGFVSSLKKKDFWLITIIAFVHAAGIFYDGFDDLMNCLMIRLKRKYLSRSERTGSSNYKKLLLPAVYCLLYALLTSLRVYGPVTCALLSYFRRIDRQYRLQYVNDYRDVDEPNLKRGMDLFYYLCVAHGVILLVLLMLGDNMFERRLVMKVSQQVDDLQLKLLHRYFRATKLKYKNNVASYYDETWNLITYGAGLLDSEMPEDNLSGAVVLTNQIDKGMPVRRQLLRSPRDRIQKLIGSLAWTSTTEREMRKLAARIVEHVACDLKLAQFPGALECISSLLDSSDYDYDDMDSDEDAAVSFVNKQQGEDMVPSNEDLILQGLRILEILALDKHNCEVICSSDVLFLKMVAPVSYKRLIQDTGTRHAWIEVTHGSLKLVGQLMRCPGDTGKVMRRKFANTSRAVVNNLEEVLALEISSRDVIVLQIRAIETLEQLYSGKSTSNNWATERRENLGMKVLPIFLSDKWMEDYLSKIRAEVDEEVENKHAERKKSGKNRQELLENKMKEAQDTASQLMEKAGEALATLSMGNQISSDYIRSFTGYGDVVHCLTEMLDSDGRSVKCRYSAAVILKHLCTHCTTLDHGYLKEITLKKVLLLIKTETQATFTNNITSLRKHISFTQSGEDTENPAARDGHDKRLPEQVSKQKQRHEERKLQVALVSLCAAIRGRCIDASDFASVVAQLVSPIDRAEKLKDIVEQIVNSKAQIVARCPALPPAGQQ